MSGRALEPKEEGVSDKMRRTAASMGGRFASLVRAAGKLFGSGNGKASGDSGSVATARRLQAQLDRVYAELGRGGSADSLGRSIARARELEQQLREIRLAALRTRRARPQAPVAAEPPAPPAARHMLDSLRKLSGSLAGAAKFRDQSQRTLFLKLCQDLQSPQPDVHLAAAGQLAELEHSAARRVLEVAVRDGDDALKVAALDGLARQRDVASRPLFERYASSRSHRVRLAALRGLYCAAEAAAAPFLVRAIDDEHAALRRAAATYLGWLGVPEAAPALATQLRDPCPEVREAAATALGDLRVEAQTFALIRALDDEADAVRRAARGALERGVGQPIDFYPDALEADRRQQVARLKLWWREERLRRHLPEWLLGATAAAAEGEGQPSPAASKPTTPAAAGSQPAPPDGLLAGVAGPGEGEGLSELAGLGLSEPGAVGLEPGVGGLEPGGGGLEGLEAGDGTAPVGLDDDFVMPGSADPKAGP